MDEKLMKMVVHLSLMPVKFYCHVCKIFLPKADTIEWRLLDGNYSFLCYDPRYYCPKCNSLLHKVCEDCKEGAMRIPKFPTTSDYNADGWIDKFCTKCGCGFLLHFPPDKYSTNNNGNGFSKRKVRKLVDQVFTRKHLPYNNKKALLAELFSECNTKETTIEFLVRECGEERRYLNKKL